MRFKYVLIGLLFVLCGMVPGCKFFAPEITGPQIETEKVFERDDSANSAIRGILASMHGDLAASPFCIALYTGLSSDELDFPSNPYEKGIYQNRIDPNANICNNEFWKAAYTIIFAANDALLRCQHSVRLSPAVKKQLIAETLFIRAYWFLYLVNLYGDIPLPLTPDIAKNERLARTPVAQVYDQIVSDLTEAHSGLSEHYVGKDGITYSNNRLRPNKAAATALLARVYLYMNRFNEAEFAATLLINNSTDYSLVPLNDIFLTGSREAIWQLGPGTPNTSKMNTSEGKGFILSNQSLSPGRLSVSSKLLRTFEAGDQRKKAWVGNFPDRSVSPARVYYFPHKYKIMDDKEGECSVILRLAEQYLIRAEARARLGNLAGAVEDLNMIRERAGMSAISAAGMNQAAVLTAILQEKQIEFFSEQGHRWFDLKRTGLIDAVMTKVGPSKSTTWKPYLKLWPLPATELLIDPNLVQNDGYK